MNTSTEFEFHLNRFVAETQSMQDAYFAKAYDNLNPPKISIIRGRKYIKVVRTATGTKLQPTNRGDRGVYFFIDIEHGDIWKPCTWKAPTKNFPRGNILLDSAADVIGPHGI